MAERKVVIIELLKDLRVRVSYRPEVLDSSRHVNILRNNTTFLKDMFQQKLLSSSV